MVKKRAKRVIFEAPGNVTRVVFPYFLLCVIKTNNIATI